MTVNRVDAFLDQGLKTFLAKYLKDYPEPNETSGHHKGQKTTFDALLPSFSPVLASVGSVSVEFSLSLSKPLKARIKDVFILFRANPTSAHEHSPEELREVFNSRVLTYCLLRGELVTDDDDNEGSIHSSPSFDIGLKPEAIDKLQELLQQSEIWIERLHIRIEDSGVSAPPPLNFVEEPGKGFAAGLTVDSIKLQGDDFNSYTTFMDEVRLVGAPDPPPLPTSMMEEDQKLLDLGTPPNSTSKKQQQTTTCLRVCKDGVLKGIKIYCDSISNNEIYSRKRDGKGTPSDSELQQLMGLIFSSSYTLPVERPILKLDTATFCTGLSLSRKILGLITSAYVHVVFSPLHLNFSFTLLGRVLRWIALKNRHSEALIYACAKPAVVDGIRRRVVCMWQHALRSVIRQVRNRFHTMDDSESTTITASVEKKLREMKGGADLNSSHDNMRNISTIRRRTLSMKWRYWFKQWIEAARYIRIRDLLYSHTELESVFDATTTNGRQQHHHSRYREILHPGNGLIIRARILPWMIPKSDLTMSEALLKELVSSHPLKPLPPSSLPPSILLALWALQLDMEVWSPIQITSGALAIFKSRVTWLGKATGLKALAQQIPWKVAVTLTLEESNAAPDEFEHATIDSGVNYDSRSKSIQWVNENGGEVLDFHVELGEEQARQLEVSQRKCISIYQKDETAAATRHVSSLSEGAVEKRSCKSLSTSSLNQGGGGEPLDPDSFPSSFLLTVTVTAKSRILGNTIDLGSATLPGGILTAKRGKVCEHRCRLIGKRQAREGLAVLSDQVELILLSTFVPPGDNVAKEERSLLLASRRRAGKWDISNPTKNEIFSDSNASETRVLDVSDLITDAAHGVKTVAQIAKECNAPLWVSVLPQELFISSHISEVTASTFAVPSSSSVQMERMKEDKNINNYNSTSSCCSTGVQRGRCLPSVTLLEFNARLIQGIVEMDLRKAAFGRFSLQINNIRIVDYQAPADRYRQSLLHVGPLKTSIEVTAKSWHTPRGGYGFLYMNNWNSDNVITSTTSCLGAYSVNWSPQSIVSDCYNVWRSAGGSGIETVAQNCLVGSTGQTGDAWITVQGFDGREVSVSASFGKFNNIEMGTKHYLQPPLSLENEELRQHIKELERQLMVMRAAASRNVAASTTTTNDSGEGEE